MTEKAKARTKAGECLAVKVGRFEVRVPKGRMVEKHFFDNDKEGSFVDLLGKPPGNGRPRLPLGGHSGATLMMEVGHGRRHYFIYSPDDGATICLGICDYDLGYCWVAGCSPCPGVFL